MKRENTLNRRKVSMEQLKDMAIQMARENKTPDIRDRGVRGMTLINQLLKCYRVLDETSFDVSSMKVEYMKKGIKNRETPIYHLNFKTRRDILKEKELTGDENDAVWVKVKTPVTDTMLTMTVIVPDLLSDGKYSTRITVTGRCIMRKIGSFYTELSRKVLYIYLCSYIMKTRNFMGLEGLQLHTPYTDMRCDYNNKINIA